VRDNISSRIAEFFYRTAIPFNVASSESFKAIFKAARPAYANFIPSPKVLGGTMLDQTYSKYLDIGTSMVGDCLMYSIATDGWTSITNDHLVNFVLLIPGKKPFFHKSLTTTVSQTAEEVAQTIIRVIEEIGCPERCCSIVTDNAANMQGSWSIIEAKYPWVFCQGCAAHTFNLLIKDILSEPDFAILMDKVKNTVLFVKYRHAVSSKYKSLMAVENVTRGLSMPVETRWYTQYTSAKSLLDAKRIILSISNNDLLMDGITSNPEKKVDFLETVRDQSFWADLKVSLSHLFLFSLDTL